MMHQEGCEESSARDTLALPREGFGGDIPSSCWNHLFQGSSLFLPCSALAANLHFSLVERKDASGQADELQDWVSALVCVQQTSLLSMRCYLGILPIGLTCFWRWGPFASTECHLGVFLIGSDLCLTSRPICVGKCLSGTLYQSSSGGFVTVLSSGVWVCIAFVWLVFLLPFVKWEIQVHFIRKM